MTRWRRSSAEPAEERAANIESNIRAVNDAAELGAACFVMVVGGLPVGSRELSAARQMVSDGIAGYTGLTEVEIFSNDAWWKTPPDEVLKCCADRLESVC